MADQIYKVRDPQGNIRDIKGPAGASDEEVIEQAKKLFAAPAPAPTPAPAASVSQIPTGGYNTEGLPAPRQPSLGQRLTRGYEEGVKAIQQTLPGVRALVQPSAEMLASAAGAQRGAQVGAMAAPFLGPAAPAAPIVGGVIGGGFGYAGAKGLLNAPAQMGKGISEASLDLVKDIGEGVLYQGIGETLGPVVGKVASTVADIRRIPKNKAVEIARNALGPDLPEVLNALRAAQGQNVSAAQATADINSPVWQALIDRATKRDPRFRLALEQSQGEISVNALANLVGGSTATQTRAAVEAQKRGLTTMTEPMRQTALKGADIGQDVARYSREAGRLEAEATEKVADVRRLVAAGQTAEEAAGRVYAPAGQPRAPGRYTYPGELAVKADNWASQAAQGSLDAGQAARQANAAVEALNKAGFKPLETAPLLERVGAISRNPEFAGNDVMQAAVANLQKDLAAWTNVHGIIPASALDAIRKNSVNAAVRDLIKGDPVAQKKAAAETLTRLRPMLVDAIEGAGGKGYREYLETYAQGMQKIAEKKLTGEALDLWKNNKDAFVKLVQGESPEVVEKFLGPGRYDIAVELAENTMSVLREQARKHITNLSVKEQASAGKEALTVLLEQSLSKIRLPSNLTFWRSVTNKTLDTVEDKIGKKTMRILTESLKTPEGAADLLSTLPAAERSRVLKLFSDPSQLARRGAISTVAPTVNALSQEQPQNALAQ